MFDGLALSSLFDNGGAPPDINLLHDRLELLTVSSSFSLRFGPGFPCESPSSVTLTVLLECPSPLANAFVIAPFGTGTESKADTFFPAGKASLSEAAAGGASREAPNVVSSEARLVRGTFHGVDTEGYVIEGRFVPRIEGGSGDIQGLRANIGVEDVFENPNVLRATPGRLKTPNDVSDLIADAQSRGWRSTRLSWGSQEGRGLKLLDTEDGRMIMYHPEGGHHGEYWKVSSGITRTTRVFPDYTEYPNGWVEVWS